MGHSGQKSSSLLSSKKLDHEPVRILDIRERRPWRVLAALNQLSAAGFDLRDRGVEISGVGQAKPEVGHASVDAGESCLGGILVESHEILATRGVEEDQLAAVTEAFLHSEDALVEPERTLEISDNKMDVCEAFGSDHVCQYIAGACVLQAGWTELDAVKMGALASFGSAILTIVLAEVLGVKNYKPGDAGGDG